MTDPVIGTRISALPPGGVAESADTFPVLRSGGNFSLTVAALFDYLTGQPQTYTNDVVFEKNVEIHKPSNLGDNYWDTTFVFSTEISGSDYNHNVYVWNSPDSPYIELFARATTPGGDSAPFLTLNNANDNGFGGSLYFCSYRGTSDFVWHNPPYANGYGGYTAENLEKVQVGDELGFMHFAGACLNSATGQIDCSWSSAVISSTVQISEAGPVTWVGASLDFNTVGRTCKEYYPRLRVHADGSVTLLTEGAVHSYDGVEPTGGAKGIGTINVPNGYYVNGVLLWLEACTVIELPSAATAGPNCRGMVTDSNATLAVGLGNTVAAGGANIVPVYSDGTNWKIG